MIIPLEPKLEGLAAKRFFNFARKIKDLQFEKNSIRINSLVKAETQLVPQIDVIIDQRDEYIACIHVLGDLAQLRWNLVENEYGFELHSPPIDEDRNSEQVHIDQHKERTRSELRPRLIQQFTNESVRNFITSVEHPKATTKCASIKSLIADGAELQNRLSSARSIEIDNRRRQELLRSAIQPYLQLVKTDERDDYTGIRLGDIWRYFRYTWSIPQTPIPGRHLKYLIRDAAHNSHAVIGIAELSNCAVRLAPRDHTIGWSTSELIFVLTELLENNEGKVMPGSNNPSKRFQGIRSWIKSQFPDQVGMSLADKKNVIERVFAWLLDEISTGIHGIEWTGLATEQDIAEATPELVANLRELSKVFANQRKEILGNNGELDTNFLREIPVSSEILNLETARYSNASQHDSRPMLVAKKRAMELARLLDAQRTLRENYEALTDPTKVLATLEVKNVQMAINTAMRTIKSRRIGTNMLEITTCGAVPPYNSILGGKLVALLLLSPQVANDNFCRYGKDATIIRSQLKNSLVVPDNNLVWLGTTSLYSRGSSQYERLRLPAGVISPDQPEIRYHYLGNTSGYGTVQFAADTIRALENVLIRKIGYREVNHIFGEGASPRLRKLRLGLEAIGFNAQLSMLHHHERRIYGIPLFDEATTYLCGLHDDTPEYVTTPENYVHATESIAEFWRCRWLSNRLNRDETWRTLGNTQNWVLSSSLPRRETPQSLNQISGSSSSSGGNGRGSDDESKLNYWRKLASAGPNVTSEGLSSSEFETMHLDTKLEDYLFERASEGISIILTGNAGDGKTHLARAIQRRLKEDADCFEFAFDATAIMNREADVKPIVELWAEAIKSGKWMVLAINQYPLYKLRKALYHTLPDIAEEINHQWETRLTTKAADNATESNSVLLVDLSLRNVLSKSFAERILKKMLTDPTVQHYAETGNDPDFSFNFECLKNEQVQKRLFDLYERLISVGHRTTIREFWILTARLLFGKSENKSNAGAIDNWYSERLFDEDNRFSLTVALGCTADPAKVSHPHIDQQLENPIEMRSSGWSVIGDPPDSLTVSDLAAAESDFSKFKKRFFALKRRYYFEHDNGGEKVFELDRRYNALFHNILRATDDDETLSFLVQAINRSYFPKDFERMSDELCLWVGHRLDEQPTKSFVAEEYVPRSRLRIHRPKPPGTLMDVLDYVPDHLLLSVSKEISEVTDNEVSLRIDFNLFRALSAVGNGLPRHLISPSELNRLDAFMDRLWQVETIIRDEILIYNVEHVTSSAVRISDNLMRFQNIRRLGNSKERS